MASRLVFTCLRDLRRRPRLVRLVSGGLWGRCLLVTTALLLHNLFGEQAFAAIGHADSPRAASQEIRHPHVVLIYTDDQGYGDAGCLNPEARFATPHLDRIAAEGISFTDAHCSDTVCTPSRYGLLTGRYCWRTELKRSVLGAEHPCLITGDRSTLATLLKSAGYRTAMVGKWHLGMDFPGTPETRDWSQPVTDMPLDKGFDRFYGIPASLNYGILAWFEGRYAPVPPTLFTAKKPNRRAIDDYRIMPPYQPTPEAVQRTLKKQGFEVAPDFVDTECLTRITDRAVEWIEESESETDPLFLYVALTSPHKPVAVRPDFHGRGDAGAYGEFMEETDYHIGRILQALEATGADEQTMVIVTSDNGPENTWKRRLQLHEHDSRGGLREGKRSIYEGGHRVPFLVRWPAGIVDPGRTSEALICQTDVYATLSDLLGMESDAETAEDSISFLRVLKDASARHKRPPVVHHSIRGRFALRDGPWKLVMPEGAGGAELYNLVDDRAESINLAKESQGRIAAMRDQLTGIILRGRTSLGPPVRNDTGWWKDLTWIEEEAYADAQLTLSGN